MKRNQFTFYASFYDAISRIRNKSARLAMYDALCAFALLGEEPNPENMPDQAAIAMLLIRPNLEASLRKSKSRQEKMQQMKMVDQEESCATSFRNKGEDESECEVECKVELEVECECECECKVENECLNTHSECAEPFEIFWSAYPKKVDKSGAKRAFRGVEVPVQQLVSALQEQQRSSQWNADGGRYIPNAATWLSRKGWEDKLPVAGEKVPKGATGLGPEELENIQRLLREG